MGRSRADKYPETDTFHYHNQNPKGRVTSGDCAFRAMSLALGQTWEETVMQSSALSCRTGYCANDTQGIQKYMEFKHWQKMKMPKKIDGSKFDGAEFCRVMNALLFPNGTGCSNVLCLMAGHCMCIKYHEGHWKVWDTWDSGRLGNKIGNFYISPDVDASEFEPLYGQLLDV